MNNGQQIECCSTRVDAIIEYSTTTTTTISLKSKQGTLSGGTEYNTQCVNQFVFKNTMK